MNVSLSTPSTAIDSPAGPVVCTMLSCRIVADAPVEGMYGACTTSSVRVGEGSAIRQYVGEAR